MAIITIAYIDWLIPIFVTDLVEDRKSTAGWNYHEEISMFGMLIRITKHLKLSQKQNHRYFIGTRLKTNIVRFSIPTSSITTPSIDHSNIEYYHSSH